MKTFFKWTAIILGALLLLLVLAGLGLYLYFGGFGSQYPSGGKLSRLQAQYNVSFYDINLEVNTEDESIFGYTSIKFKALNNIDSLELDLVDTFDIEKVLLDEAPVKFSHEEHKLYLFPTKTIPAEKTSIVTVYYSGQPPEAVLPPWRGGFTWSEDDFGNPWVGLSCQGEGAKIWFPCKDHPSDEPDSAAINITVVDSLYVASNGLLKNISSARPGYKTFHWFTGYSINNYLINFGIGKYEIVKKTYIAEDGTHLPVVFYVLPQMRDGADDLLDQAIDMLETNRKFFGEYPWIDEKFGLLNTDYYGMEHQTIIAYGNNYRNFNLNGFEFDKLLLHEMGHEWWGNKVTAGNWADFWIHEGICTYSEALYALDKMGEDSYHDYMDYFSNRISNRTPIAIKGSADSEEGYTRDIYHKGACFIHTLRYVLGDSVFFKTLKEFATDSAYTFQNTVTTKDFLDLVNYNSGQDHTDLFELYLYTTTYPQIMIDSLAVERFNVSIPNIDFKLPMDVTYADTTERMLLGKDAVTLASPSRPVVDEMNWYLKEFVEN